MAACVPSMPRLQAQGWVLRGHTGEPMRHHRRARLLKSGLGLSRGNNETKPSEATGIVRTDNSPGSLDRSCPTNETRAISGGTSRGIIGRALSREPVRRVVRRSMQGGRITFDSARGDAVNVASVIRIGKAVGEFKRGTCSSWSPMIISQCQCVTGVDMPRSTVW